MTQTATKHKVYVMDWKSVEVFGQLMNEVLSEDIAQAIAKAKAESEKELLPDLTPDQIASGEFITLEDVLPTKLAELLPEIVQEQILSLDTGATFDLAGDDGGGSLVGEAIVEYFRDVDFHAIACMILDGVKPDDIDHRQPL